MVFTLKLVIITCASLIFKAYSELKYNNVNARLVLELLKAMPGINLVASPMAVRFSLCKLAAVATGEAKTELMTALGYKDDDTMLNCFNQFSELLTMAMQMDLTYVNKIFVNYTDDIEPEFIKNSETKFGVGVSKVGFSYPRTVVEYINRWISTSTFQRIQDVFDDNDIDKNTTMVIASALHYKGSWEFPFNYKLTKQEIFHHSDGRVSNVDMMTKVDSLQYIDAGEFQAVNINFGSAGASMTLLLSFDRKGLPNLINKIYQNPYHLTPFLNRMRPKSMIVKLPRFQIKSFVDWTGFLQEMRLYEIFNCTSPDLKRILIAKSRENNTICLNKVKQRTFIQIDEMGTARHIYRPGRDGDMERNTRGAHRGNTMELVFNRPFYFTVNLEFSPTMRFSLFTGVYYGPE